MAWGCNVTDVSLSGGWRCRCSVGTMPGPSLPDDLDRLESSLLDRFTALAAQDEPGPNEPGPNGRGPDAPLRPGSTLTIGHARRLFRAQLQSRHLDHAARWLRARGQGFYTIGSAGHEGNAGVAAALRVTDPALLHYRSGGFYLARAQQRGGHDGVRDILAGLLALVDEPIAGGRHKVFGHPDLGIIPQTSTIASHLPRAVGVAFAIDRASRLGVAGAWPHDAVTVCSFGDASANHSTAQGAINSAAYTAHSGIPLPLLFVCEDNGWGISVPTPQGWIESAFAHRPGLRYEQADGSDLAEVFDVTSELVRWVRATRRPALLHLRTVRLMGHAGTDVESGYRSAASIRADEDRDPLVGTARLLVASGAMTSEEIASLYIETRAEVRDLALSMAGGRVLVDAGEVMEPLSPRRPTDVAEAASIVADDDARQRFFGASLPEHDGPLTLAETINRTLGDVLASRPEVLVFGEDVGVKGGVYGVTRGLRKRAGAARVFDSLLDEQSILGLALGAGVSGMLPIPEIQYLAYLHNAEDQLRGEGASLSFFSQGRFRNPMVVRVAGLAYQKGFGGHFHNDNAIGVLRDIPGLVIACPAHPRDAAPMLRTCVASAATDGTVSVYLEPIALYHTRDLHEPGDGLWTAPYAPPAAWAACDVPIGRAHIARDGHDVLVVTWANGLFMSLRVAERLAVDGISCRVLDMRWLAPLPMADVVLHATQVGRVLVVDETRHSGGVGEGVIAGLVEAGFRGEMRRVAALDSFIPIGDAALTVLVRDDQIEFALRQMADSQ